MLWYSAAHPLSGDDIEDLAPVDRPRIRPGRVDGIFGPSTDAALREFQRNVGMTADGTCGRNTVVALNRFARAVGGALERLWTSTPTPPTEQGVTDKLIVLDRGRGAWTAGWRARPCRGLIADDPPSGWKADSPPSGPRWSSPDHQQIVTDDMSESGARRSPTRWGADLVISLHRRREWRPRTGSYTTTTATHGTSPCWVGASLRPFNLRSSRGPTWWTVEHRPRFLGPTQTHEGCPRCVEVGYLTHSGDAARLTQPRFRDTLAEAIASAAVSFFSPLPARTRRGITRRSGTPA